jgi:signal transduction histidine kinase
MLSAIFPNARGVALVPIWDANRERWFAGGLVWTQDPTRILTTQAELSYLRAFGSAVMGEVARLDMQRADKAKADVLGSLSHELRSPLHGIVLGIELLHDTSLDSFQEDVLHTLETCSRTLLDTMDHVRSYISSPLTKPSADSYILTALAP